MAGEFVDKIPPELQESTLAELRRRFRAPRKTKRYIFEGEGRRTGFSEEMR